MKTNKSRRSKDKVTFTRAILIFLLLIGIYYFIPQLGAFKHTFSVIGHASPWWLLLALFFTCLSFIASAITQFTAGNYLGTLSTFSSFISQVRSLDIFFPLVLWVLI